MTALVLLSKGHHPLQQVASKPKEDIIQPILPKEDEIHKI